ncbi:MAG: hypothetical protein KIS94_05115 [Chitinophagales bacterium]|nr:hypothetical protein [Chitinophagales bacterium]
MKAERNIKWQGAAAENAAETLPRRNGIYLAKVETDGDALLKGKFVILK